MSSWHEAIPPFVIVGAAFVAASYALDFTHKLTHNGKVCKFPFRISTFSDTLLTLSPLFAQRRHVRKDTWDDAMAARNTKLTGDEYKEQDGIGNVK